MELREQFDVQWLNIRNVVLSESKRQIALKGKVDTELLTTKLREETAKWQRGVLAQGLWFKAFKEAMPNEASMFSIKAAALSFLEPAKNKKPSNGWICCVFVMLAALLGYVLHRETDLSVIEQMFYPILSFAVMQTLYVPVRNKRKTSFERRMQDDIGRQLDAMHQDLEWYVEQVEFYLHREKP